MATIPANAPPRARAASRSTAACRDSPAWSSETIRLLLPCRQNAYAIAARARTRGDSSFSPNAGPATAVNR